MQQPKKVPQPSAAPFDDKEVAKQGFPEGYVLIRKEDLQKSSPGSGDLKVPPLMRSGKTANVTSGRKLKPLRTRLVFTNTQTSAAGGSITAATAIDPSGSTEWSSFISLYDEMKVHGGEVQYHISAGAGGAGTHTDAILTYDPLDSTAISTIPPALTAQQNSGVLQCPYTFGAVGNAEAWPAPVTKTGMWNFKFKCPEGASKIASSTAADQKVCTGQWISTVNSVNPAFGYLKPVINGLGGTAVMTLDMYIILDVTFRSRA